MTVDATDKQGTALQRTIAFVGTGVMAESMIHGLLNRGIVSPVRIRASHPRADRRESLVKRFGIKVTESNADVVEGADFVFLTVKPQALQGVLAQVGPHLRSDQVVVSIIAGADIEVLEDGLKHRSIVRVMPNTPAQVGEGMMVWAATPDVSEAQREDIRTILAALGEELYVDEEKYVDMATALSGTGPTYVFLMMEALIDAGVHMGFPRRIAEQIVLQTVSGSVDFARASGKHMAELRNMVTSPGGTSAEAIYQMEKGGLRTVFSRAVYSAYRRTQTLAEEQKGKRKRNAANETN